MSPLLRLWFGLRTPVSRRAYALSGFGLAALKASVDVGVIRFVSGATLTPLEYLHPFYAARAAALEFVPSGVLLALALWTLPFLWIGASMTMRRAIDAGVNPHVVLLFFLPPLNLVLMLVLCFLPSRPRAAEPATSRRMLEGSLPAGLLAVGLTALFTTGMMLFSVYVAREYGHLLFFGVPFLGGMCAGAVYNGRGPRSLRGTLLVATASLAVTCGLLLMIGLEGLGCIALMLPLALPVALGGAAFGWGFAQKRTPRPRDALLPALLAPLVALAEPAPSGAFEVASALEIDAPPALVWPNVIGFSELPPPDHWVFATGIAYPVRAVIQGEGVGAVRHCEFTTGPFVEPITHWEPPVRLAFDVAQRPEPMEEWSFYERVHPPHLESSFRAVRGEFRLIALEGGRTRLEGSTWYELELAPTGYWRVIADWIVHRIHTRVLAHVRTLSESAAR